MTNQNIVLLLFGKSGACETYYRPLKEDYSSEYTINIVNDDCCNTEHIPLLLDLHLIETERTAGNKPVMTLMHFPKISKSGETINAGPIARWALTEKYGLGLVNIGNQNNIKIRNENDFIITGCNPGSAQSAICKTIKKIINENRRKAMKHIYKKETLESIKQYAEEHNNLSSKDIMTGYLTEFAGMTGEAAAETAEKLIHGVSSFKDLYAESVGKGLNSEKIKTELSNRLLARIKNYSDDDANRFLFNLYNELSAQSRDNLAMLADSLGESNMSESLKNLKETNKAKFEGLSREEQVKLIADAVDTCGTISGIMSVAVDDRKITLAPRDKTVNATFESADLESTSESAIRNTFEDIINMNYTALAAYVDRDKTESDEKITPEAIGALAAADYERKKIFEARLKNILSADTLVNILGIIAQTVVCVLIGLLALDVILSTSMLVACLDIGTVSAFVMLFGIVAMVTGGAKGLMNNTDKIKDGVKTLFNGAKDILVTLFNRVRGLFSHSGKAGRNMADADNESESEAAEYWDEDEEVDVEIERESSKA